MGNLNTSPTDLKPPSNPDWLDKLTLTSMLGSGSFGGVFQAISSEPEATATCSQYAVKVTYIQIASPVPTEDEIKDERRRMLREYKYLKGKQHPNIVTLYDALEKNLRDECVKELFKNVELCHCSNDTVVQDIMFRAEVGLDAFFIKMELCGETLRQWINCEVLGEPEVRDKVVELEMDVQIVQGLIEGIRFLHAENIMHRDLKPENVFFGAQGFRLPVKIGDFGLVRYIKKENEGSHHKATPRRRLQRKLTRWRGLYMAPECDSHIYTKQCDLYSLGLIVWQVFQPILPEHLSWMFDLLVARDTSDVVDLHPKVTNSKYLIEKLTYADCDLRFKSIEEVELQVNTRVAYNEEYLHYFLQNPDTDCKIELLAGHTYIGDFEMRSSNVILTAQSKNKVDFVMSTIEGSIRAKGCTGCEISCIAIEGNKNPCQEKQWRRKGKAQLGLNGRNNIVSNVIFSNCDIGLEIKGDHNAVRNITIKNTRKGINVAGNDNTLSQIIYALDSETEALQKEATAITFRTGKRNCLDGLVVTDLNPHYLNWGIQIEGNSTETQVTHSPHSGPVSILGKNHTLNFVGNHETLLKTNRRGHTFHNCVGQRLIEIGDAQSIKNQYGKDCKFDCVYLEKEDIIELPSGEISPTWKICRKRRDTFFLR